MYAPYLVNNVHLLLDIVCNAIVNIAFCTVLGLVLLDDHVYIKQYYVLSVECEFVAIRSSSFLV